MYNIPVMSKQSAWELPLPSPAPAQPSGRPEGISSSIAKFTCQQHTLLGTSGKEPGSLFLQLEETSGEAGSAPGRAGSSGEMLKMAACTGKSQPASSKPP